MQIAFCTHLIYPCEHAGEGGDALQLKFSFRFGTGEAEIAPNLVMTNFTALFIACESTEPKYIHRDFLRTIKIIQPDKLYET